MNKKLIINENLNWPLLDETASKKILEIIESNLKLYQSTIKRKKTPPKHLRAKKETIQVEESKHVVNEKSESIEPGILLKQRLRLGINAVTKTLETEPNIVKFVLVCRSCVPLKLLTRHLYIMCAQLNVPAGCVNNMSKYLASFLNIKSISAFAICEESLVKYKEKNKQFEKESCAISILLNEISDEIKKNLKPLENPLSSKICLSKELIENTKLLKLEEFSNESDSNMPAIEMTDAKNEVTTDPEKCEEFGSDFISFDTEEASEEISFNSSNFILFNDDYENIEDSAIMGDKQFENYPSFDRNRKRKLNVPFNTPKINKNSKNSGNMKFTKLKLINKKENNINKNRKNK